MIINQTVKGSGVDIPAVSTAYSVSFPNTIASSLSNKPYLYYYAWAYRNISSVSITISNLSVCDYCFAGAFTHTPITSVTGISISGSIVGDHIFEHFCSYTPNATGVIDLSISSIYGAYAYSYAFANSGITGINFPYDISDNYVFQYACSNCPNLTSLTINSNMIMGNYVFSHFIDGSSNVTDIYFPMLDRQPFADGDMENDYPNVFTNMLAGCDGVTVHFPYQIQEFIYGWSDVVNGFGGTNTIVMYDQDNGWTDPDVPDEPEEPEEPEEPMEE